MSDFALDRRPDAPPRRSQGHVPSPSVQATMGEMTSQLETIIDAAERASEAIRRDAQEQARHHLVEAQRRADRLTAERVGMISELTDDLVRHATTVRDHSEQMIRALEEAVDSVTAKLDQPAGIGSRSDHATAAAPAAPGYAPGSSRAPQSTASPASAAPISPPPPPVAPPSPDEALIHATRLAVAGNDRATISAALRDRFGIADPGPLVARVLGEGGR